jgi:hypothetical protein
MHPHAEAPPQNQSTDGDRTLRRRVFGDADRRDDENRADATGGRTADPARSEHREDDTGTPHDDVDPAAIEEPAQHDPVPEMTAEDMSTAGPRAGTPTGSDEPADLNSGHAAVTVHAEGTVVASIWAEGTVQDLRDRWHEAQLRFVDDPRKVANDTRNLVNEAVEALTAALASHREQLNSLPTNGDTEQYRLVVQRSRTFFERLLTI